MEILEGYFFTFARSTRVLPANNLFQPGTPPPPRKTFIILQLPKGRLVGYSFFLFSEAQWARNWCKWDGKRRAGAIWGQGIAELADFGTFLKFSLNWHRFDPDWARSFQPKDAAMGGGQPPAFSQPVHISRPLNWGKGRLGVGVPVPPKRSPTQWLNNCRSLGFVGDRGGPIPRNVNTHSICSPWGWTGSPTPFKCTNCAHHCAGDSDHRGVTLIWGAHLIGLKGSGG